MGKHCVMFTIEDSKTFDGQKEGSSRSLQWSKSVQEVGC